MTTRRRSSASQDDAQDEGPCPNTTGTGSFSWGPKFQFRHERNTGAQNTYLLYCEGAFEARLREWLGTRLGRHGGAFEGAFEEVLGAH